MAELLQKIRTQINNFYKTLDKRKKIWLALGGLFLVLVIVAVMFFTRPVYVPLATGVELEELGRIITKLDEMSIQHKEEASSVVLVDVKDLTRAKVALATDLQISQPDYGWTDVFADTSFTTSNEVREQQIIQAKTTVLSQAIKGIEGVKNATVLLDIAPESSFLLESDKESRVSVIVELEDGFQFSNNQVTGLVNLIHTSTPNLPKENITILDQNSQPLNKFSENTEAFLASSNYEQTMMIENQIEDKITRFLAAIYGMPNVKVGVSVKLNFDGFESQKTVFSPPIEGELDGMIRSATEITEKLENTSGASGIPGTDSNTEFTDYPEGTDSGSAMEKASKTVNYELNEVIEVMSRSKGQIEDISISVLVNEKNLGDAGFTEEDKTDVINLVTSTAGIETRAVTVVSKEFADESLSYRFKSDEMSVQPGIPILLVFAILGVILIIVVVFFVLSKRKANKEKEAEIAAVQESEQAKRQDELAEIQTDIEDKSSPKYQIEKFIDAKPEAVAALLRSWMSDM